MPQIINVSNEELISEIAIKNGDKFFKDFDKDIYNQALYRAQRSIALQYSVLERIWDHVISEDEADTDERSPEIPILPLNFGKEYAVLVDGRRMSKCDGTLNPEQDDYYIRYTENQYVFNCVGKEAGQKIRIYYTAGISGEEDYDLPAPEQGEAKAFPVLPNQFHEELIKRARIWLCECGVAEFKEDKQKKYMTIYRMLGGVAATKEINPDLIEDHSWTMIKPYQPL